MSTKTLITVATNIVAPIEKVWKRWITPDDIIRWNNASEDWHTPKAENDLQVGGKFVYRMEAKDGSMGFDFGGIYNQVRENELIEYTMDDGRNAKIHFKEHDNKTGTEVVVTFEAEELNPVEMQREGWQAILDNFKKYVELNPDTNPWK